MRNAIYEAATAADEDELLTTGEAAHLLNTSRQHIVDLCNIGDLPFVTTGRHRRIARKDVEALRTRTQRLTRDQKRSLWLGYAIAGKLALHPDSVMAKARENLDHLKSVHSRGQAARWLSEWGRLLVGPVDEVLAVLTSPTPRARELRQNSPFADVLTDEERLAALEAQRGSSRT